MAWNNKRTEDRHPRSAHDGEDLALRWVQYSSWSWTIIVCSLRGDIEWYMNCAARLRIYALGYSVPVVWVQLTVYCTTSSDTDNVLYSSTILYECQLQCIVWRILVVYYTSATDSTIVADSTVLYEQIHIDWINKLTSSLYSDVFTCITCSL